jgi:glucose/arabinose dehydrogenase
MRLGVWGWVCIVCLAVLGLVGAALRRPLYGALTGDYSVEDADAIAAAHPRIRFEAVAAGFEQPLDLQFVPGRDTLAVVLQKTGRARWLELSPAGALYAPVEVQGRVVAGPGPDLLVSDVRSMYECGLLGLAFHPRFAQNGLLYTNDIPAHPEQVHTRISEWHVPPAELGRRQATLTRVLLDIERSYQNHNGGQLVFGPDGYLYIGLGDGGSANDPHGNGQNLGTLHGKMLRIDVDAAPGYRIPPDNPLLGTPGARPEIWAYGLRNPWRITFDPRGRLVAADVGQALYEEVSIVEAGGNHGWSVREGFHCFAAERLTLDAALAEPDCPAQPFIDPIFEYDHRFGQSITGGYVYLGAQVPWLRGKYLAADFVSGRVWALTLPESRGRRASPDLLGRFGYPISSFGRDAHGEVYALDFARGVVLKIAPAAR